MNNEKTKRVIILGAGPAGLNLGQNILAPGLRVDILEKDSCAGGLCRTFKDDGYRFDFGPHNIHTNKDKIYDFLRDMLGDQLQNNKPKIKIFFNGRFVSYPLKGIKVFGVLRNPWMITLAFFDFLLARMMMSLRRPRNEDSFKKWIINRFGRALYRIYFEPYAEKAWKIPSDLISSYVAEKRVPTLSIRDYIRGALRLPSKTFHSEDWTRIKSFYPRFGVGQVIQCLERSFLERGGIIHTDVKILEINRSGPDIESLKIIRKGKSTEELIPADFLVSTMPVNEFIQLIRPLPPAQVLDSAKALDYCSEKLLYIKVNRESVFDVPLVYFQSPLIKFNRIYDVRRFSSSCVPEGKDLICVEFTCSYQDETWNASAESLFEEAISVLEKNRMLSRKDVGGFFIKEVIHAYPRFRIGFQARLDAVFDYLEEIRNVITLGRQGLFCYANLDEVLDMGFRVAQALDIGAKDNIRHRQIFSAYLNSRHE